MEKAHYTPPWSDPAIIGVAGSSGSGKTSLAVEIVSSLSLPWVVILSMVLSHRCATMCISHFWQDSFYKALNKEDNARAHANEYDFDSPEAIDFDILHERLKDIKAGYASIYLHVPLERNLHWLITAAVRRFHGTHSRNISERRRQCQSIHHMY